MPPMHRQTFGIIFLFSNTQNDKHAQGCPLVVGHVVAPQTAEARVQKTKNRGWSEQTSQWETYALGSPLH